MTQAVQPDRDRSLTVDVRAVIDEYFRCVDMHDFEGAGACFTTDATTEFAGQRLSPGRAPIVEFLRNAMSSSVNSRHFGTNVSVRRVDAEHAHAEVAALVFAIGADDGTEPRLIIRGVRYLDKLRRIDGNWLIAERSHRGEWVATAPVTMLPIANSGAA